MSRTGTPAWLKLRKRALAWAKAHGIANCPLCDVLLDYEVSRKPDSAEVDHIQPFAQTGTVAPPLEEVRVICRKCNQSRGGKEGAARAREARTVEPYPTTPTMCRLLAPQPR